MQLPGVSVHLSPGLSGRVLPACIGIITLAFILLCLLELLDARRDATSAADMQARNIAASVAQDVARNLDVYDLSLQEAVSGLENPRVAALEPALRRMLLFPRAARAPYFDFINVLDADGNVTEDSRTPEHPANFASRDYFQAQRTDSRDVLFIGSPFLTKPGQSPTISLSRRVSHPDGSFAGVVVGSMRLAYFRDLFAQLGIGAHGAIMLLRQDGMILMRLPFAAEDIGRTLPPDAPFYRARDGGRVDAVDPADHLRRRFIFRRIGMLPLVVGVGLADRDIYAAWRSKAAIIGIVVVLLGATDIALLLVWRAAQRRRDRDEAALRQGHAQLASLAAQREHALAAMATVATEKSRFLATMSHELRTPLNSVLGYAELLVLDGQLDPLQASRLAALRGAGQHLRDVIDQVLDFSRLEADGRPTAMERVALRPLIEQSMATVAPLAAAAGLALRHSVASDLPDWVIIDSGALRQVLLNLLGNAVKFTPQGEVALRVTRATEMLRFAVADSGIGVPDAQRSRLFHAYERLDEDRSGRTGSGLGLAIASRLVAGMGGGIGHETNPAGGSIFWFTVPLRAVAAPAPAVPAAAASEPIGAARPAPRLHVLIADDSPLNRDVTGAMLRREHHTVVEAEDGDAAVRLAAAEDFDVVLMDLRMPRLTGAEAVKRLRQLPGCRGQVPVIALTAQVAEDGGADLRAAGFQAYLLKPVDRETLLATIAAVAEPRGENQMALLSPVLAPDDAAPASATPEAALDRHAMGFATEIAAILARLEQPAAGDTTAFDLAHRIAGDASQLGFLELAAAARKYEAVRAADSADCSDAAAALQVQAAAVLEVLRQRSSLARRADICSAKLP